MKTLKKAAASAAVASALTAALTVGSLPTAEAAGSPGCVTQREFAKVKKGFSKERVARVFGTPGKRQAISVGGGYRFEIRSYKACTRYGAVSAGFANGKLDSKSAVF